MPHPPLRELKTVPLNEATYGITDRFYKDMLLNIGSYYYSLTECNTIIEKYNKSVGVSNDSGGSKEKGTSVSK